MFFLRFCFCLLLTALVVYSAEPSPDTLSAKKKTTAEPVELVAFKNIPGLLLPPGTRAQVFADHDRHQVYSPTALCFDEKGRMLVTETYRFRFGVEDNRSAVYWLFDDLAAETVEDRRAMHEKWQIRKPLKDLRAKSEVIRFLEDTDGDGMADRSEVYADGFNDVVDGTAAGIFHLNGTSYFASIPKVWTLRDTNDDGISDERGVIQDGFGVRVSFSGHDLNGFALGPDGRIYGTVGDRGFNITTKEGRRYSYPDQGCIFRFEPDGSNFEVLHTGLRNPKEIAFDKWGNGISVDNNSDQGDRARIVYLMEGADSGWRMGHQTLHTFHSAIGIPELPLNAWMAEGMWKPKHQDQPSWFLPPVGNLTSGPSGLAYHPGGGFSTRCKDRFLICDYRGSGASSGIWSFELTPHGAGMKLGPYEKFNWGAGATDVEFGYDGKIYVTDFVTGWKSHAAGRIYSLEEDNSDAKSISSDVLSLLKGSLANKDSKELARLMDHPDLRIRTRAHLALAEKNDAFPVFQNILRNNTSPLHRLHATWGLWKIARSKNRQNATTLLTKLLVDSDPEIRAQAARALGEAPLIDTKSLHSATEDGSTRVQAFSLLSLARLQDKTAWPYVLTALAKNNNQDDALRHAGVMALIGCGNAQKITDLKNDKRQAIRLAAVVALRTLKDPGLLEFIADPNSKVADEAIRAIHDLPLEEGRPNLARMLDHYGPGGTGRELTRMQMRRLIHSAFRFGTPESVRRLLLLAQNTKLHLDERLEALRLVNLWPEPPVIDQSTGLFSPLAPRDPADVLPILKEEFPSLLKHKGSLLSSALTIAKTYQLDDHVIASSFLSQLLADTSYDLLVRQKALVLFVDRKPPNLIGKLKKMSMVTTDPLSGDALAQLSKISPKASLPPLRQAILQGDLKAQRNSWKILGNWKGEEATPIFIEGLQRLTNNEIRLDVQLELLEAAEKRKEPQIASALTAYQESLKNSDPLAEWKSAFYGGNPKKGARLFRSHPAAQCARCHRAQPGHAEGGEAGPNLYGIGETNSARSLVESLVQPHANITPGYGIATITLTNGDTLAGNVMRESRDTVDLLVGKDLWRIKQADIKQRNKAISSMPPMGPLLSKREIRDLVAWLTSQRGERVSRDLPEAKPYLVKSETVAADTTISEEAPASSTSIKPTKVAEQPKQTNAQKKEEGLPAKETSTTASQPSSVTSNADTKESAPKVSDPQTNSSLYIIPGEPREDAESGSKVFWTLFTLFWISVCLVPVLIGLKNR